MAVVSGKNASIAFATGYVVKARSWTVDIATEEIDTTELGDDWKSFINGVSEWSGSYEALIDTVGSLSMGGIGVAEGPAAATFTAGSGIVFSGTIMITGVSTSAAVAGGATAATFTFRGSSSLTV